MTCGNWTKGGSEGSAMTGHHDRAGPIDATWAVSWNSSHPTRGCGRDELPTTGGDGVILLLRGKIDVQNDAATATDALRWVRSLLLTPTRGALSDSPSGFEPAGSRYRTPRRTPKDEAEDATTEGFACSSSIPALPERTAVWGAASSNGNGGDGRKADWQERS